MDAKETPLVALRSAEVSIAELIPHPRNYRKHPPEQIAHIVRSLQQHGFYRNVVAARGVILAGHGVVQAAQQCGLISVPCVSLDIDPYSPAALKLLAGDNEIAGGADDNDRALAELLKELAGPEAGDDTLLGTGFDRRSLATLVYVTRTRDELTDFSAAEEWAGAGMPEFDVGTMQFRLIINFANEADRDTFTKQAGVRVSRMTRTRNVASAWWPDRDPSDRSAVRWEQTGMPKTESVLSRDVVRARKEVAPPKEVKAAKAAAVVAVNPAPKKKTPYRHVKQTGKR